ncbi:MAG: serine hydrolase [Chitinivibrionia bacterium]|nr:serine hydrolase [Chitinivibrionia bacterium]
MKTTTAIILIAFSLICRPCNGHAAQNPANTNEIVSDQPACKLIDDYLTGLAKDKSFSGGLLIVKNSEAIFKKGYGFADREDSIPFTPATLGSMGSITKAFTAAAIMKLAEQGKLSLNDTLKKFFPEVPPDKARITIKQLLTHSSGLPAMIADDQGDYQIIETEPFLDAVFSETLLFEPGTKAIYTNIGMSVLAIIIERVSGMDYEQFLKKELFAPASIKHIGYQFPTDPEVQIAIGYRNGKNWGTHQSHFAAAGGGPYWNLKGNGGLEASLDDMYLWINAITNKTILSDTSLAQMFTPHIVEEDTDGRYYFGYGCNVTKSRRGTTVIDNGGSNGIYYARLLRYPEDGVVMYMVTNESSINAMMVLSNVTQLYFLGKIEQDALAMKPRFEYPQAAAVYNLLLDKGAGDFEKNLQEAGITIQDDMALLEAGQALTRDNKIDEAIALYEYYTKAFPNIVVAQNDLGDLYVMKGEKDKAIACYKQALVLRPGNPRALEELKNLGVAE